MARHPDEADTNPNESRGRATRDEYRDNDDVRDPIPPGTRNDVKSDSRNEARGDARENVGNHSRDTARDDYGPEGNDRQRSRRDARDEFDEVARSTDQRLERGTQMLEVRVQVTWALK